MLPISSGTRFFALLISIAVLVFSLSPRVQAQTSSSTMSSNQKLKTFLMASAYGTVIGAALGGASLAFSSNPTNDLPNIAKGASLGLYAGMIYGYVSANTGSSPAPAADPSPSTLYLTPQMDRSGQIAGTELHFIAAPF